jgi:hypothetical protein
MVCIIHRSFDALPFLVPRDEFLQVFPIDRMEIQILQAVVEPHKPRSATQSFGIGVGLQPPVCNHRLERRTFLCRGRPIRQGGRRWVKVPLKSLASFRSHASPLLGGFQRQCIVSHLSNSPIERPECQPTKKGDILNDQVSFE